MTKYIDADRLQAEIKEIENEFKTGNYYLDNSEQAVGYYNALMDFKQLIFSLQQEQNSAQDTELTYFESALFTAFSYAWQDYLRGEEVNVAQWAKENSAELLEAAKFQQEQQEKSKKDCNGCPHCVDRKDQYGWHFKGCFGGPYNGKFIAEIDECPLKQEQPEVDLEEEMRKELRLHYNDDQDVYWWNFLKNSFRHFYELGLKAK